MHVRLTEAAGASYQEVRNGPEEEGNEAGEDRRYRGTAPEPEDDAGEGACRGGARGSGRHRDEGQDPGGDPLRRALYRGEEEGRRGDPGRARDDESAAATGNREEMRADQ